MAKNAWKVLFALVIGLSVAAVVFVGFALYVWTAIHSGWSQSGIYAFYIAMYLLPLVIGLAAGYATYRLTASRLAPKSAN